MDSAPGTNARLRWRGAALGAAVAAATVGALLHGCTPKRGAVEPPPPSSSSLPAGVTVTGNTVRWRTEAASAGSVRYGFEPDDLDHMAYPVAAGRRDREMRLDHEVPLLDLRPGRVYLQTVNESAGAPPAVSAVGDFDAAAVPGSDPLTATMIHIGFGDSHLLTMPNGKHILVDGGERAAARSVAEFLHQHGVTALDAAMATHVHIDHLGGLVGESASTADGILAEFAPRVCFDSPQKSWDRAAYHEELATLAAAAIPVVVLERGDSSDDTPELAWDPRVHVVVLSSGRLPGYSPIAPRANTDINNDSIVLELSYGDVDLVIGGDAEAAAEASILDAIRGGRLRARLDVEYYKVHHHGLPDATTATWVAALVPRVAFVPNSQQSWDGALASAIAQTTRRLTDAGADVYVVDDAPSLGRFRSDGVQYNVTFATDGRSYEVRLEPARQTVPPRKPAARRDCLLHDPDLERLLSASP
jgi:beta-lactamase superfamily II metal-dependent hydrolase